MNKLPSQRFVSLHGFFAFTHPSHWRHEPGESGHYIFYDPVAGSGVLRVMTGEDGELKSAQAIEDFYNKVLEQQQDFGASAEIVEHRKFVEYVQAHELNGTLFSVYHWVTVSPEGRILLFAYTVQTVMRDLPIAEEERKQIKTLLGSLEFLSQTADHG